MRVLHLTTARTLYSGQRMQLNFEFNAARDLGLDWETVALHTGEAVADFEKQIPRLFHPRLLVRLYGWIYAINRRNQYDIILFRDMQLDIFGPLLGWLVPNRITVHHAKEVEELSILRGKNSLLNRAAVLIEKHIKPFTMRTAWGLAGVTNEIRQYEVVRFPWLKGRTLVYPNGYDFRETYSCDDRREAGQLDLAFVCSEFAEWHGLDRLTSALSARAPQDQETIIIHLVGKLNERQRADLTSIRSERFSFIEHGSLQPNEVTIILSECDAAIGSLALDRQGLTEASTLKVREYLAAGLPVYATHKDAALPESFLYFMNDKEGVSIERLITFIERMSSPSRDTVRTAAQAHLDKCKILENTYSQLEKMANKN